MYYYFGFRKMSLTPFNNLLEDNFFPSQQKTIYAKDDNPKYEIRKMITNEFLFSILSDLS